MCVPNDRVYVGSHNDASLCFAAHGLELIAEVFPERASRQRFTVAAAATFSLAAAAGDFVPADVFDSWAYQVSSAWRSFVSRAPTYCWPAPNDLVPLVCLGATRLALQSGGMFAVAPAIERTCYDLLRHTYGSCTDGRRAWRLSHRLDRLLKDARPVIEDAVRHDGA